MELSAKIVSTKAEKEHVSSFCYRLFSKIFLALLCLTFYPMKHCRLRAIKGGKDRGG